MHYIQKDNHYYLTSLHPTRNLNSSLIVALQLSPIGKFNQKQGTPKLTNIQKVQLFSVIVAFLLITWNILVIYLLRPNMKKLHYICLVHISKLIIFYSNILFMIFKKENLPPVKQGVFYELYLNKNNGPYLSKDISFNNPKSSQLLTNKTILKQHKKMVQTLTQLSKTYKLQPSTDEKTQSFNAVGNFCQIELDKCNKLSQNLTLQQRKLKGQFENLYENISIQNNRLLESYMPILKNLSKKVKEAFQNEKAEYYKIKKQLQSIQMEKRTLEYIITSCNRQIEGFQRSFGGVVTMKDNFFATSSTNFS